MSKGTRQSFIKLPPTEQLFDDWYDTLHSPILPANILPDEPNETAQAIPSMSPAEEMNPTPPSSPLPYDPLPLTISPPNSPGALAAHNAHLNALRLTNELASSGPRPSRPDMERRKAHLAKRKVLKKGQLRKGPLQKGIKIPWNPDLVKRKQGRDGDGDGLEVIEGYGAEYESSSDDNLTFNDPVLAKKPAVEEGAKKNEAPVPKRKTQLAVKQRTKTPMDEGKGKEPAKIDGPSAPIKKHGIKTKSTPPKANKLEIAQPVTSDPLPSAQEPKATSPKPISRNGTPSPPQQKGNDGPAPQAPRELSKSRRPVSINTSQHTSLPVPAPTQLKSRLISRPSVEPRKPSPGGHSTPEMEKYNIDDEEGERYKRDWPIKFSGVIEVGGETASRGEHVTMPVVREESPVNLPHESMPVVSEDTPVPTEEDILPLVPVPAPAPAAQAILPVQVTYSQTSVVVHDTARPATRPAVTSTAPSSSGSGIKKPKAKSQSQTKSKTKAKRNRRTSLQMLLEAAGPNYLLNERLRPH